MDYQSDKPIIDKKVLTDYNGTFIIVPTLTEAYSNGGEKLDQIEVNVWTFGEGENACGKGRKAYKKNVTFPKENNYINPTTIEEIVNECLIEISKSVSDSHILTNTKTRIDGKLLYKSFELKKLDAEAREDDTVELNLNELNKD